MQLGVGTPHVSHAVQCRKDLAGLERNQAAYGDIPIAHLLELLERVSVRLRAPALCGAERRKRELVPLVLLEELVGELEGDLLALNHLGRGLTVVPLWLEREDDVVDGYTHIEAAFGV